jgi:hypothetical protein
MFLGGLGSLEIPILLLFWGGFAFLNGKLAKWKGYPFWVGAISGIVLFWGTILFLIMPFNKKGKNATKTRPYCGEKIAVDAKKCKHCGE